jgi:aspartate-semialdehyde dehydrogenase
MLESEEASKMQQQKKIPVGVLGVTGVVGQRFIQMLDGHPWFEVAWLAASERSAGAPYGEAVRWKLKTRIPENVVRMRVSAAVPGGAPRVIFAALDARTAAEVELKFAEAGYIVVSNSSAFRMHPEVPLVIPEVNADHLAILECQQWRRKSGGFMVTNPNCTAIGLVMALAPLARTFGIEKVSMVSMQAVSGAGYPGVASLDIMSNVIPYIAGEEEKVEAETRKLLGRVDGSRIRDAEVAVSAQCNRVAVEDGHTESVSVKLKSTVRAEDMVAVWESFRGAPQELQLPSAPEKPVTYEQAPDRPQPKLDRDRGGGMTTVVGRLRPCSVLDWKFTVLSHNTIRGAAGAALLNAELLKAKGYLQ